MIDTRPVQKDMLKGFEGIEITDVELDFQTARGLADDRARRILADPLLLAWFDKKEWKHSPAIC